MPLERRAVFQVDQTASQDQVVLRHVDQCCQHPDLDRRQHLRARGDREEGTEDRSEPERNPANSQYFTFRENADPTSISGRPEIIFKQRVAQPADFIQQLTGQ